MRTWLIRFAVVLALAGAIAGGTILQVYSQLDSQGPSEEATTLVLAKGASVRAIARQLEEAGVITGVWRFLIADRLTGGAPLLAGEYTFPAKVSLSMVLDITRSGRVVMHRFTLPEGWTVSRLVRELEETDTLTGDVGPIPEEGSLLPQTYFYVRGDRRDVLIERMKNNMDEVQKTLWRARQPGLALKNVREALILASIVEKETSRDEERPHVAAVFLNRLSLGMRLQSDPTTIYALSDGEGILDRQLKRSDLTLDHPYNTYVAKGLPPAPICNPGRASLAAVLNPLSSKNLYFVADGSGGHLFSRNLDEHNRNVQKLRKRNNSGP